MTSRIAARGAGLLYVGFLALGRSKLKFWGFLMMFWFLDLLKWGGFLQGFGSCIYSSRVGAGKQVLLSSAAETWLVTRTSTQYI